MSAPDDTRPRLPHASPFLLLDRVVDIGERGGAFVKLVSAADPCVHDGVLPAAFVLEALAQGGGAYLAVRGGEAGSGGYLAAVDDFRLVEDVRVGDEMRVEVEVVRYFGGAVLLRARALVDGNVRAEGRITLKPPR